MVLKQLVIKIIAELFNKFFCSMYTVEDMAHIPVLPPKKCCQTINMIEFTASDVQKLLSKLNCNKSPGPDNIHPRVIKECAGVLAEPLCFLFTTSLQQGQLPGMWKDAKLTPIFKRGSRADVGNYRPISLTSICCKTMEKLVRDSLLQPW